MTQRVKHPSITNFEKWLEGWKSTLDESLKYRINSIIVKGRSIDDQVGIPPLRVQFKAHIILVDTLARRFGPAGVAPNAIFNVFFTQINDLDPGTGIPHSVDELIKHQMSFTLAATPWAGVNCKNFHTTSFLIFAKNRLVGIRPQFSLSAFSLFGLTLKVPIPIVPPSNNHRFPSALYTMNYELSAIFGGHN
jgi:hypothetical protein